MAAAWEWMAREEMVDGYGCGFPSRMSGTDQQTRLQPGCPSLEKLSGELSRGAPSSAPGRVRGPGASS